MRGQQCRRNGEVEREREKKIDFTRQTYSQEKN